MRCCTVPLFMYFYGTFLNIYLRGCIEKKRKCLTENAILGFLCLELFLMF